MQIDLRGDACFARIAKVNMPVGVELELYADAHLARRSHLLLIAKERELYPRRAGLERGCTFREDLGLCRRRDDGERSAEREHQREEGTQANHQNSPTSTAGVGGRKPSRPKSSHMKRK